MRRTQPPSRTTAPGLGPLSDEIERFCADLAAAGFIAPVTRHRRIQAGTDPEDDAVKEKDRSPAW